MNTDRLMADVARLATACAWWFWSRMPRTLTVASPAEDEHAEADWTAARDAEHTEANRLLDKVHDQRAALELLRERSSRGDRARRHARHAIRRAFGSVPIDVVHGFGEASGLRAPLSLRPMSELEMVHSSRRGGMAS